MATTQAVPRRGTNPWRYAVGFFGMSLPINLVNSQLAFFYIVKHGLDARAYGAVMLAYFVVDLFDNPFYGWLSDRTRSRWGRRRPWIVAGAPVLALSLVALFSPPVADKSAGLVAWFALWAILTQTFDSLISASYGAVLPEAFGDEKVRALANSARQGFQLIAMVLSIALTPMLTSRLGYATTAIGFAVLAVVVITFTGVGVREDLSHLPEHQAPLLVSLKAIVTNPTFWTLAIASGLYSGGMVLVVAAVQFFVTYTLGRPQSDATFLLIAVIFTSMGCLVLWTFLVRRFTALPMWRLALGILAAALAGMLFARSLASAIVVGCVVGLGYSGVMATIDLIVARLLDEDTARTGVHRASMFLAAFSFFNHTTGLIQALAFTLAAWLFGFRSGDDPGQRPGDAARFLLAGFPLVLVLGSLVVSLLVRFRDPTTVGAAAS